MITVLIKKEIIINADIQKVWSIFSQLENWPKWGCYILQASWVSKNKWKVGSRFTQTIKGFLGFKEFKSNPEIITIEPYKIVTWAGTRKLIKGTHTFKFQKIGSKTKVSNEEYFTGLLAPILLPFFKNKFEFYFEEFLNGLKKETEKIYK